MKTRCLGFLLFLLASACDAYVLPVGFIIQQMAQKYANENPSNQQWKAMIMEEQKVAVATPAAIKLDQNGLSFVINEKNPQKIPFYFADAQWACRGKSRTACTELLTEYFKKTGIDTSIISLTIFDNEPAYIVGALPGDAKKPQLWLDKETLLPERERNEHEEITWRKWIRDAKSGFTYPRLINIKTAKGVMSIANG